MTIPASITARLAIADWVTWNFPDPLEPIMAAPLFETPMYEPLRDISQEFCCPASARIPPDTVTLVIANQRFIEAYMAGLSHEMARELLYHEYPTDQRGTYFRQFWDVRGAIGEGGVAARSRSLRDIEPIHLWRRCRGARRSFRSLARAARGTPRVPRSRASCCAAIPARSSTP